MYDCFAFKAICDHQQTRFMLSIKMMLDFYGMKLGKDDVVRRAPNWRERLEHLNRYEMK